VNADVWPKDVNWRQHDKMILQISNFLLICLGFWVYTQFILSEDLFIIEGAFFPFYWSLDEKLLIL
jgi:hypothetical protein